MDHRHSHASLSESRVRPSRWIAAAALTAALVAPAAVSAGPPPAEPTTVNGVVAAVQGTYAKVNAIRSDFTQVTKNPLTGVEEKKKGRIQIERPRKMRMELGAPLESAFVTDGTTQWLFNGPAKELYVQKVLGSGVGMEKLLDDLSQLDQLFDVVLAPPTAPPKPLFQLTLKPKQAGGVKSIELAVKKQTYQLQDLVITDVADGVTRMSFVGMVLGGDIPDAQFTFKAPPGVTVKAQ